MQSEISWAGCLVSHSAKSLCEIGPKAPSGIDKKTPNVGLPGGVESSVWSSELLGAVLLGFWTASEATSWGPVGEPNPSRYACHSNYPSRLRTTPLACRRALSPRHVDEKSAELNGLGQRLFVHACHLFMGQLVSSGDREPSDRALLAEVWRVFPPQPSEPALPAVQRRGLVLSIAKQ